MKKGKNEMVNSFDSSCTFFIILYIVYSLLEHKKELYYEMDRTVNQKLVMGSDYWKVLVESCTCQEKNGVQ